ncbi:MAG: chromosomal replication initiator protein DnaA [Phycisphaerales bacterium]|nr:chromosomal replication initiator protein DnaA [Phycisphaerales bacterium]
MATISYGFWNDLLDAVRRAQPDVARAWFRLLKPGVLRGGVLIVHAAKAQQREYLQRTAQQAFTQAVQSLTGRLVTVQFEPPAEEARTATPDLVEASDEDPLLWRPTPLSPDLTFEEFVVGPCNRLAHAAAGAVAESPGRAYNPFFLCGSGGSGKTHLLHAICREIQRTDPGCRCVYVRCDQFATAFLASADAGREDEFRQSFREVDVLAIDDVQRLSERERSQEEFFHTFNALSERGSQMVLAADRSPRELAGFQDRLTSRFNSGLVTVLDPPCYETRLAILRKKCKLRCLEMPEDVIEFVAVRVSDSPRRLEEALREIDALAHALGGEITLDVARQAIGDVPRLWVALPAIVEVVRRRWGVQAADLSGPLRKRTLAAPRHICMYLARHMTQQSLSDIGAFFGGRDHSTVLHAVRLVAGRMESSPEFRTLMEELRQELARGVTASSMDVAAPRAVLDAHEPDALTRC